MYIHISGEHMGYISSISSEQTWLLRAPYRREQADRHTIRAIC